MAALTRSFRHWLAVILSLLCTGAGAASGGGYTIGVYYFPGWTDGAPGLEFREPWKPIKAYPDREPLLGWYSDSDAKVLRQQIQWMTDYGIKFVVFDSYWKDREPFLDHALKTFKRVKKSGQIGYALLWANHFRFEGGAQGYDDLVKYWVSQHFTDPDYLKVDGRPVLFIFSLEEFSEMAKILKKEPAELVRKVDQAAKAAGFPGVMMVGATPGLAHWVRGVAPKAGFSSLSAYNYHIGYSGEAETATPRATNFGALRQAYRTNWNWILENSSLDFIVPISAGWDDRPWGGRYPASEQQQASLQTFEEHLREAKALMNAYPAKTRKMGVICCWNEFGEGSYIEPTKKDGFGRLEKIKTVFGAP
ncbi:MAG: hypothetical protein EKK47_02850 [Burkholderiales bacterium]|jgi:hypothetical protein|nr:MAG: hypothetical protein EKK47_02850 [Burkholderiales bacterium]